MEAAGKDETNIRKKIRFVAGPWGGNGGASWDDGVYSGVREIVLVYDHCIDSIRVIYDKHGKLVTGEKHGGVGGNKMAEIKLQLPDEYLVGVSGHYSPVINSGTPVICSITFRSNKRTFGPYGVESGTPFSFSSDGGEKIVGFKGRSGWFLDEIGLYLSPAKRPSGLYYRVQQTLKKLVY
ncbi:Jacalin-type lectin domain-containing protein [Heracleum sosnowskyi]|uniref:Jacalin-type lectin domain-containing protein n=1 Tax=Heracleum sosnowskyi TaxID=360622 RepID=A0AAD8MKA5_9APIA|nr:Jacalin-type lectin domain-containing protein [Heracleum sosnowskyi]